MEVEENLLEYDETGRHSRGVVQDVLKIVNDTLDRVTSRDMPIVAEL